MRRLGALLSCLSFVVILGIGLNFINVVYAADNLVSCDPARSGESNNCNLETQGLEDTIDNRAKPSHSSQSIAENYIPVETIQTIIRDYLLEHPEILLEAQQILTVRRAEREALQTRTAIHKYHDKIFRDLAAPVGGNPDGSITLVEFFDYRCGYCRQSKLILDQLLLNNTDVRVVYKEFPILGAQSTLAARAALAARKQRSYLPFHAALMSENRQLNLDRIRATALSVGLSAEQLLSDMNDVAIDDALLQNRELATALNINSTPSFVIGEKIIRGAPSLAHLHSIIDHIRQSRTRDDSGS